MNVTKIEWCDYSWNPIAGCSPISVGCENCYAAAISRRFGRPWGEPVFYADRLDAPRAEKKPGRVFVASMADLGHEKVLPAWRAAIYDAMYAAPWHQYIVLTKRPGPWLRWLPHEAWRGVTVESAAYMQRWEQLVSYGGGGYVRFVSVEPMLGPVSFRSMQDYPDWVIAGPETGPQARGCCSEWLNDLDREARCFFDKRKVGWTRREFPAARENAEDGR